MVLIVVIYTVKVASFVVVIALVFVLVIVCLFQSWSCYAMLCLVICMLLVSYIYIILYKLYKVYIKKYKSI